MNRPSRPRNRQPRGQQDSARGRGGRPQGRDSRSAQGPTSVPKISQVVSQAHVSIVLKQDQPTGREVQGIVQDVLTKGNHPRGIKVRLQDGQIGRVQRMASDQTDSTTTSSSSSFTPSQPAVRSAGRFTMRYSDHRYDEQEAPPPRTLADFLPDSDAESEREPNNADSQSFGASSITAKCPICGDFEGDEIAVSRHVEGHLT